MIRRPPAWWLWLACLAYSSCILPDDAPVPCNVSAAVAPAPGLAPQNTPIAARIVDANDVQNYGRIAVARDPAGGQPFLLYSPKARDVRLARLHVASSQWQLDTPLVVDRTISDYDLWVSADGVPGALVASRQGTASTLSLIVEVTAAVNFRRDGSYRISELDWPAGEVVAVDVAQTASDPVSALIATRLPAGELEIALIGLDVAVTRVNHHQLLDRFSPADEASATLRHQLGLRLLHDIQSGVRHVLYVDPVADQLQQIQVGPGRVQQTTVADLRLPARANPAAGRWFDATLSDSTLILAHLASEGQAFRYTNVAADGVVGPWTQVDLPEYQPAALTIALSQIGALQVSLYDAELGTLVHAAAGDSCRFPYVPLTSSGHAGRQPSALALPDSGSIGVAYWDLGREALSFGTVRVR